MENIGKYIINGFLRFVTNCINRIHMYFVEIVSDSEKRFVVDNVIFTCILHVLIQQCVT